MKLLWLQGMAATAAAAAEPGAEHHGEETFDQVLMHHVANAELPWAWAAGLHLSKAALMMLLAAAILIAVFGFAMRRSRLRGAPHGVTNALEALALFIRDEVAISNMGEKYGRFFTPFLLTQFFFILTCNLVGLLPLPNAYTPTSNINVTATLALITLLLMVVSGVIAQGPIGYFKHMVPAGTPLALAPLLIVIETLGLFIKPIALTIRLGANMTAGHIVILVMLGFIFIFKSLLVVPLAVPLAAAIMLLEIIVAFIQAYVFTLLTAIFIGMVVHPAH